jgi:hypothetical protein
MDGDFGWFVQDDLQEGIKRGVRDIPALFINGKLVETPLTINRVNRIIREALADLDKESRQAA